ncbi:MAG: FMN-binding protein [Methylococcales bacterium]|nr:FMN-binding protein [Methylococcales bacterium]
MSESSEQQPQFPKSTTLISTLGIIAMIAGLLVVVVYEYTQPIIAENQRVATENAIFKVLPTAKTRLTFLVDNNSLKQVDDKATGELLYAGYDSHKQLVGIALNAAAQGYQDVVKLLYSYQPETGCITAYDVLKSTETPGFGTKITTDEDFLANFNCLQAAVNEAQTGLENSIKTVRHGTKKHPFEIDAISGSTITSNAVGRMLNQSGQRLHPLVEKNLILLKHPKHP